MDDAGRYYCHCNGTVVVCRPTSNWLFMVYKQVVCSWPKWQRLGVVAYTPHELKLTHQLSADFIVANV